MDQNRMADRCSAVAGLSRQALEWLNDPENADTVGLEKKSLAQLLRKSARRADKLTRASRTKMSVSVFGPSQAGKSFLVSVLARPAEGRLVADFNGPDGKKDYIREINPEGEGESTGLVTRFTMSKDPTPDGFPIKLTLLSEADIARTIINSFFNDGDQSEEPPEPDQLAAHLEAFTAKAGPAPVPGLAEDDMLDVAEYLETGRIGRSAYAAALKSFKESAAALAPRLSVPDRGAFLSIYWGGYQPLTDLYVQLSEALAQINHASEVFVPLAALIPRETSIIDVKTLHGLFGTGGDTLAVRDGTGKVVDLPRAVVCALAAELVFPMETEPSPLFGQTDLLDFPGARNRFEKPLSVTLAKPEETVTQLLLRGKVAYLFDRYVENQEITSMLLCVPDSNMETLDLPLLVDHWIALTHGTTPEQRALTDCILFFVMTKFDKHLGESAASGGDATRFERRMQASLLEKFGKSNDRWVDAWTPGTPFKNCYWLRNPNFFMEGLINYDAAERELEIRPEKVDRVAELRAGCLSASSVQTHFKAPEVAWDAALALNDGGVSYLLSELTAVCKPASKMRQIGSQIDKLASDLASALGQFYISDDVEKRIEEKRLAAATIIDGLEYTLQSHRFGAFLRMLSVDQDAVQDLIARVPSSIRISSAVSTASTDTRPGAAARPGGAARPSGPVRPGRPARPSAPAAANGADTVVQTEESAASDQIRTMSAERFQSETAVALWVDGLKQFREDEMLLNSFGLSQAAATDLTSEMIHALRRIGVQDRIVSQLKSISYGQTVDKQAPPASIVCSEWINHFVATLGFPEMPEADRPVVDLPDGSSRRVFPERPDFDNADALPADPRAAAEDTWTDWVYALDALMVANAKDTEAGEVNIEQNLMLGQILSGLTPDGAAVS